MASLFPLGSEGPVLPRFKTLLVKGPYHASAPIHLSVSHLSEAENDSVLFITPSRKSLKSALISFNDNWVTKNATTGHVASLLSRVSMFYPPSPAHLCLLLSLFQLPDVSLGRANPKTIIATKPSLLVIHELSEYFRDDETRGFDKCSSTLADYLSSMARIFASFASLTKTNPMPVSVAVFDSQLDNLTLPITRQLAPRYDHTDGDHRQNSEYEITSVFTEGYFEWIAAFEEDCQYVPSSQEEEMIGIQGTSRQMRLFLACRSLALEKVYRWTEEFVPIHGPNVGRRTQFIWNPDE